MTLIALGVAGIVLILAYCGVGRPKNFVRFGFATLLVGMLLIVTSPGAIDTAGSGKPRQSYQGHVGARAGGLLIAAGVAGLLAAAGFRRPSPNDGHELD